MKHITETTTHAARKRHRCSWCWQFIGKGEQYKRYVVFDSGETNTVKMHPECHEAMLEAAAEEGGWMEWTPGMERPAKPVDLERSAG